MHCVRHSLHITQTHRHNTLRALQHFQPAAMASLSSPVLQLYDDDHSLFCAKVKVALYAKGVAFTSLEVPCGTTAGPEYTQINPMKKIPALKVTEQEQEPEVLLESGAILEWLEERFPHPGHTALLPADAYSRAQVRSLAAYHDHYLEPSLRKLYPLVAPRQRNEELVTAALTELQQRLDTLEVLLDRMAVYTDRRPPGGWAPLGSPLPESPFGHLTLGDCGYVPAFLYIDMIVDALRGKDAVSWGRRTRLWKEALDQHPAVQAVLTTLRPAAQHWLDGKLALV